MLENRPAILHNKHRGPAPILRIFCGTCAIGRADFCKCDCRFCDEGSDQQLAYAGNSRNHVASVLGDAHQTTAARLRIDPVAHASRVFVSASRRNSLSISAMTRVAAHGEKVRDSENAIASTQDACATGKAALPRLLVEFGEKRLANNVSA